MKDGIEKIREKGPAKVAVFGASAGGIEILLQILPKFPANFPMPFACVIHMPPSRSNIVVELFTQVCAMKVKEAEPSEPLESGTIYFSPTDYHLSIEPECCFSLSNEEPVQFSRPSIDVLFESAAKSLGSRVIGILLTGSNDDGANGLRLITKYGGIAIAQDPAEAKFPEMPSAGVQANPSSVVLRSSEIPDYLSAIAAKDSATAEKAAR